MIISPQNMFQAFLLYVHYPSFRLVDFLTKKSINLEDSYLILNIEGFKRLKIVLFKKNRFNGYIVTIDNKSFNTTKNIESKSITILPFLYIALKSYIHPIVLIETPTLFFILLKQFNISALIPLIYLFFGKIKIRNAQRLFLCHLSSIILLVMLAINS